HPAMEGQTRQHGTAPGFFFRGDAVEFSRDPAVLGVDVRARHDRRFPADYGTLARKHCTSSVARGRRINCRTLRGGRALRHPRDSLAAIPAMLSHDPGQWIAYAV